VNEIAYQLRFRNIGGLIIIDLIDMEPQENREKVYRALQEALRQDKAKTNILKISELGLVEMTRKRTRESLVQMLCDSCPYCEGKGYIKSEKTVCAEIYRALSKELPTVRDRKIKVKRDHPPAVGAMPVAAPAQQAAIAPAAAIGAPVPADDLAGNAVKSPMVGTAFLSPEPGASPFIAVGDSVKPGDTLLIVEAMKVMNPITATSGGVVKQILIGDAQPVEFDQPLVVIE
jgi:acetyl-CoA carboxylase biotin carboxyl carrier protein